MARLSRGPALYDCGLTIARGALGSSGATRAAAAVLLACGLLCGLVSARALDPAADHWLAATLAANVAAIAATGIAVYRASGRTFVGLAITPFSIAVLTWLPLFVLRPFELYVTPDEAAFGLAQLGVTLADLTRTAALGGLGISAWCIGYLIAFDRGSGAGRPRSSERRPFELSGWGAVLVVAAGTALWIALFLRQGGVAALRESAVSIREGQFASFYAFIGVWMVQGAGLYALGAYLRTPSRVARWTMLISFPIALAAAVALQLRMLAGIFLIAAAAIYVSARPPSRRGAVLLAAVAAVGVVALGVFQQVRELSHYTSTGEALRLTLETRPRGLYESDLSTFDHFVAMQQLVPSSIPYLDGETIGEIPAALVPRRLWPDKPRGIDFMVSGYLYPGATSGAPISLQGELYWNRGPIAVVLGSLVLGALLGLLARFGLWARRGSALFLLYAVSFPFTYAFLTRSLAVMTENVVFALVGCAVAVAAMARHRPRLDLERLRGSLEALDPGRR